MHLGNKKVHQDHFYSFKIDNKVSIFENTNKERDLGIILQDNLKWDNHISNIIHKANYILGKLRNIFKNWDIRTFKVLFTSYVRPILEYGSIAWCPNRKHEIKRIEKTYIQRGVFP